MAKDVDLQQNIQMKNVSHYLEQNIVHVLDVSMTIHRPINVFNQVVCLVIRSNK